MFKINGESELRDRHSKKIKINSEAIYNSGGLSGVVALFLWQSKAVKLL